MIYEAEVRKSLRNGKYMFFLRRDGHTIRVSDACYLSQESAVSAARRAAYEAHGRIMLQHLAAPVFRVRREPSARTPRTIGPIRPIRPIGRTREPDVQREISGAAMPGVLP